MPSPVQSGGPAAADLASDAEVGRLRDLAREAGVEDRVVFRGRVGRRELPALFRSADLAVCVPWYEPFGIVPLEAMAADPPEVFRDADAERALLTGLHDVPDLPGLWVEGQGRRRPASVARLTGIDTARFVDQVLPGLLERQDVTVEVTGIPAAYAE
ncbi:MAG: glycosyltransferase, partial [Proteobacteria bacterium]|nr:glycosyltransferase [Pseudomonadota bacterium]